MVQSLCLRCILFTLEGKQPEENYYVKLFLIWLSQLRARGGLVPTDCLQILIDTPTLTYLLTQNVFHGLLGDFPCQVTTVQFQQPSSVLEGMMWKYACVDYSQECLMYCDIDILVCKSLHQLVDRLKPGTLYVHVEGTLADPDYGEAFPDDSFHHLPGLSAGKWIVTDKELGFYVCRLIQKLQKEFTETQFYTVEQPLFNVAVYTVKSVPIDMTSLTDVVSGNGHAFSESTVLFDCCGDPGNGTLHYEKMFEIFLLLQCGAYLTDS